MGSEMCIRDRFGRDVRNHIGERRLATRLLGLLQPEVTDDRVRACLLYTSDAADERSSVDLGGRRIIKKKNTTQNRGRTDLCINIRIIQH